MGKSMDELTLLQQQNLFILDRVNNLQGDFHHLALDIPGVFHLNDCQDLHVLALSEQSSEHLGLEAQEVVALGLDYFEHYMHPHTKQIVIPSFMAFYQRGEVHNLCTEIQTIRVGQCWEELITVTKINREQHYLLSLSIPATKMHLSHTLAQALEDRQFIRRHFQHFMSLTAREKEILGLVAQGLTNAEIGAALFISSHTVRTHRNRIFAKLEIKTFRELIRYSDNFL